MAICCASFITCAIASSRQTSSRVSSATAASTAAISSGSGGSGMYSLAPAWIAATAARALFSMPQATIGTWMCSSSSLLDQLADVDRDLDHQQVGALAGAQHGQRLLDRFGVGDGGAAVHRDLGRGGELALERADDEKSHGSLPLVSFGLDDFRHGHAELVLDQHHLAARDQAVVDVDVDRLADLAVELQHGAGAELEQVADLHAGAAEHRRHLHRHVEHRFEIGRAAGGVAARRRSVFGSTGGIAPASVSRLGSGTLLLSLMVRLMF